MRDHVNKEDRFQWYSETEYKGQLESVQLSYKVRLFKGALSQWSTFFVDNANHASLFAMELEMLLLSCYFNISLSLVEVPTNLNCDKSRDTAPLNKNNTWNRTLNYVSCSTKCMIRNLFTVLVCDDRLSGQWLCHVLHQPRDLCRQH